MVRVSLPLRGAAVVLLCASAAAGQTSLPTADFSDEVLDSIPSRIIWQTSFGQTLPFPADFPNPHASYTLPVMWQYEEASPTLETSMGDIPVSSDNLTAFALPDAKDAKDGKDAGRLKPTPSPSSSAQQPSTPSAPVDGESFECLEDGFSGPFVAGEGLPCADMMLPFACPPSSRHKCRRRHQRGGNPYLDWPCAMSGCPGFGAPPPSCGHKGLFRHRGRNNEDCYGYAAGSWGMGCGGFMGPACPSFYCPPPAPACSCRKCQRKHARHQNCGGGYAGPYGGYGAFDDPNCYLGVWSSPHRCGLFHRCHARRHAPPPCPYPNYGFAMQPCMGMDMGMDVDLGMDMGFCPSCSMGAAMP